ncbi:MAG: cytochrome c, partial [Chitinophagaceae bacterium]
VVIVVTVCSWSFVTKQPNQGALMASIKRGSLVYEQSCVTCHQANGAGVPNLNPPLAKTTWVSGDKNRLIKILLQGLSDEIEVNGEVYQNVMPPHNFLTDQQIADVLTYVRNSFGNKSAAVTVAEVKTSRAKLKL